MPAVLPTAPSDARVAQPWTLAETLHVLRTRRLVLVETSRGLRVRHQHRHAVPGLEEALAAYAPALRVWQRLGGPAVRIPAPWRAEGWDEATRLFAAWFGLLFEPPPAPLVLRPGETITDWRRFREGMATRLALGPNAPGATYVAEVLTRLFVRFAARETPVPTRRLPLAA